MSGLSELLHEGASLRSLVETRASQRGQSPFLLAANSDAALSYAEFGRRVAQLRAQLASRGLGRDQRVGLVLRDPLQFSVAFIAALSADVWVAPLDPNVLGTDVEQLRRQIDRLELGAVVSDRAQPPGVTVEWLDLTVPFTDFASLSHEDVRVPAPSGGGVVLSSSGTTGTPKVMALGVDQLLFVARAVVDLNALDESQRGLNPLPLWHINAEVVGLLSTLVAGASLVLDDRFHRNGFWSMVERNEVTWINAVPAMIARLAELEADERVPSRVRFIRSASAPLSTALLAKFEAVTGLVILESYGMTEAASQICANQLNGQRKAGSVGRPIGVEVRVSAAKGVAAGVGEVGDVEIRGTSVIRAYEAAGYEDRFDAEGWLRTNDVGYFDEEGFLFLVGRSDDVINRGGEKIFPREIEELVLAVAAVVGAAVVGVPDDVYGQVPVLFVQLGSHESGPSLDEMRIGVKEVRDTLIASVGRTRRPSHINVVANLPANATGKIKRKDLEAGLVAVLIQEPLL